MVMDEDWLKQQKEYLLSDRDREVLGKAKRVSIMLESRQLLRLQADKLRGLANQMHFEATRTEVPEMESMTRIAFEVFCYQSWLREEARRHGVPLREGRLKDSERLGHNGNGRGTGNSVYSGDTQ